MARQDNTERNKAIVKHYKITQNKAETGRFFNLTRARITQIVSPVDK